MHVYVALICCFFFGVEGIGWLKNCCDGQWNCLHCLSLTFAASKDSLFPIKTTSRSVVPDDSRVLMVRLGC